jgi:hypothetical protein
MKKLFILCALLVIAIPQIATADHIGVYSDCSGASCTLAPGFTTTPAVVHKFSIGAVGSQFKIVFPEGTTVFSFVTQYTPSGDVQTGTFVGYGSCLQGSFCIGNLVAILTPGPVCVQPANGFPTVTSINCSFVEKPATGGAATIGSICYGSVCTPLAVESSTWGSVKALYR